MPAAPTVTATYPSSAWNTTTTPKTVSVTVAAGDKLYVFAGSAPLGNTFNTPTGGGLTYTLLTSIVPARNCGTMALWEAACPSSATFTLSLTVQEGTPTRWGFLAYRVAGSPMGVDTGAGQGVDYGAHDIAVGLGPYVDLVQSVDAGLILMMALDGSSQSGAARSWGTVDGNTAVEDKYEKITQYAIYAAHWATNSQFGKQPQLVSPTNMVWVAIGVLIAGTGTVRVGEYNWSERSFQTFVGGKVVFADYSWSEQSNMQMVNTGFAFGEYAWSQATDMSWTPVENERTHTISRSVPACDGPDPVDDYIGVELSSVPEWAATPDIQSYIMLGGTFTPTGPGAEQQTVEVLESFVLHREEWYSEPGFVVKFRQHPGPGFVMYVTLRYLLRTG